MRLLSFIILLSISLWSFSFKRDYLMYRSNQLYKKGFFQDALKLYNSIYPKDDEILYNIANTLYKLKRYKEALLFYKAIRDINLEGSKLYNMGNIFFVLGYYKKAFAFYKSANKFLPDDKSLKYNLKIAKKRVMEIDRQETIVKLQNSNKFDISKAKKRALGIRTGVYEGINLGGEFPSDANLTEAKYSATLLKSANIAKNSAKDRRGLSLREKFKDSENNRTIKRGDERSSLKEIYYENVIKNRKFPSLLIEIK